ncbi:tubulin epsilon chain-like [Bacillus rossius redtenbacheri]|uniref:tubulin epsilon chain-like n=1 Tax=Bacillus rossius redtenbacheri TaxID=93214 RepID=UPI002FDE73F0
MSEFITLQVGQCGNQIGAAFWPLALREHGFQRQAQRRGTASEMQDALHSFFHVPEHAPGRLHSLADLTQAGVSARAVCVDMEDSVVARFSRGPLRHLFDSRCLITSYPGSGNNWAEGFHQHGRRHGPRLAEAVRRAAERCDRLHGFVLLYSLSGGTGSGLGSSLLARLADLYPHVDRLVTCVYPAGSEDVVTAPYNVALATRELLRHATCVFPVHNKALVEMCEHLKTSSGCPETSRFVAGCKPFQDMNSIIVNMLLHLTSGSRFPGSLNVDVSELATNMVPFPGLHFVASSFSPVNLGGGGKAAATSGPDLCVAAVSRRNQLTGTDPWGGVLLAAALAGRGSVSLADLRGYVDRLCKRRRFVPWGPVVKVGLCRVPAAGQTASLLALANSSSTAALFSDAASQFAKLYRRKAHAHHYLKVEGFDEEDFKDSEHSLLESASRYREMENVQKVTKPRLRVLA